MLINLTPHALNVLGDAGGITVPPSGTVARLGTTTQVVGDIGGIPLVRTVFGEADGLPDPQPNTYYIVSALVRSALPSRGDLLSPGDLVRDGGGNVVGCRNLITN